MSDQCWAVLGLLSFVYFGSCGVYLGFPGSLRTEKNNTSKKAQKISKRHPKTSLFFCSNAMFLIIVVGRWAMDTCVFHLVGLGIPKTMSVYRVLWDSQYIFQLPTGSSSLGLLSLKLAWVPFWAATAWKLTHWVSLPKQVSAFFWLGSSAFFGI